MSQNEIFRRYARLRVHEASILTWCVEGKGWEEMTALLAGVGVNVSASAVFSFANRRGYTRIHPYCALFEADLRARFVCGRITANELNPKYKTNE